MAANKFLELAVSLSIQVALVVGVVHLLARLCRRGDLLCRLWGLGHGIILVLVAVAVSVPHVRLFHPWESVGTAVAGELVTLEIGFGRALFVLWLLGAVVSAIALLVRSLQASRFLKTCSPLDHQAALLGAMSGTHEACGPDQRQSVRFLTSPLVPGPCCWQFHQPYIVLPEYLLTMDPRELGFVVRHELAHLRTGHPLQLFVQRLVQVVFWFHPAVYWSARQAAVAREIACDEAALDSSEDLHDYLTTLLAIATGKTDAPSPAPSLLNFGRTSGMVARRIHWLVRRARERGNAEGGPAPRVAHASLVGAAVLIALVWFPLDILASPRSNWSPWPGWSARVLHDFGFVARDYEVYDHRFQLYELLEEDDDEIRSERAD